MELKAILTLVGGFVIIFVVVILVIRSMLGSHADVAAKRLQKLNEDNLRREVELKRKLDEAERAYRKKLAEAEKEAQVLKEKVQKEALELKENIIRKAEREKEGIISDAKEESEGLKAMAALGLELNLANATEEVLKQVFTSELSSRVHEHLVDLVINELGRSGAKKIDTQFDTAEIITPYPLTAEQKKKLNQALNTRTGQKLTLIEKSDDHQSIAGIYIKLGSLIIDGTLHNKFKQALSKLKTDLKV